MKRCSLKPYGLECIRPEGHQNPVNPCFAVVEGHPTITGVYLYQDGKEWVRDRADWPDDAVVEGGE